jgi:undecaprenyl-diphosphatase
LLVVLVLVVPAVAFGLAAAILAAKLPRAVPASPGAIKPTARAVERELRKDTRLAALLRRRTDPAELTGLLMTLALAAVALCVAAFGVLVYMVGDDSGLASFDAGIDRWASANSSGFAEALLDVFTNLASTLVVVVLAVVILVFEHWRAPSRALPLFLLLVLAGQGLLVELIKEIVDRARPAAGIAGGLGPSFPSGHAATAAACFAAFALVLSRRRGLRAQSWLVGVAVGLAVAVATTRVLLSVHWFTDAVAGLAVGWAWFSLCALAFGGRLLHFGAPVEVAVRAEALEATTERAHPRDKVRAESE